MARPNTIFDTAHKGDFDVLRDNLENDPSLLTKLDEVSKFNYVLSIFEYYVGLLFIAQCYSKLHVVEWPNAHPLVFCGGQFQNRQPLD